MTNAKWIGACSLTVLIALYVVGAVSGGSLRHEVQTLPLWFPIVMGFRGKESARWSAVPCLVFWLVIMIFIWLFLLGWAHLLTGHFSAVEIAMTLVIGMASGLGIFHVIRWRTSMRFPLAIGLVVLFALLQVAAFRISMISYIATH